MRVGGARDRRMGPPCCSETDDGDERPHDDRCHDEQRRVVVSVDPEHESIPHVHGLQPALDVAESTRVERPLLGLFCPVSVDLRLFVDDVAAEDDPLEVLSRIVFEPLALVVELGVALREAVAALLDERFMLALESQSRFVCGLHRVVLTKKSSWEQAVLCVLDVHVLVEHDALGDLPVHFDHLFAEDGNLQDFSADVRNVLQGCFCESRRLVRIYAERHTFCVEVCLEIARDARIRVIADQRSNHRFCPRDVLRACLLSGSRRSRAVFHRRFRNQRGRGRRRLDLHGRGGARRRFARRFTRLLLRGLRRPLRSVLRLGQVVEHDHQDDQGHEAEHQPVEVAFHPVAGGVRGRGAASSHVFVSMWGVGRAFARCIPQYIQK